MLLCSVSIVVVIAVTSTNCLKLKILKFPLENYRSGDWISFIIDTSCSIVSIKKNGKHVAVVKNKLSPGDDWVFAVVFERGHDAAFIEQAVYGWERLGSERVI